MTLLTAPGGTAISFHNNSSPPLVVTEESCPSIQSPKERDRERESTPLFLHDNDSDVFRFRFSKSPFYKLPPIFVFFKRKKNCSSRSSSSSITLISVNSIKSSVRGTDSSNWVTTLIAKYEKYWGKNQGAALRVKGAHFMVFSLKLLLLTAY